MPKRSIRNIAAALLIAGSGFAAALAPTSASAHMGLAFGFGGHFGGGLAHWGHWGHWGHPYGGGCWHKRIVNAYGEVVIVSSCY